MVGMTDTSGNLKITLASITSDVTSGTKTLVGNNAYIADNGGGGFDTVFTLPATCQVGQIIKIIGLNSGGWTLTQGAGQVIKFGNQTTTSGTGGSLASTNRYDCIELICVVADTTFIVFSSVGNIQVI